MQITEFSNGTGEGMTLLTWPPHSQTSLPDFKSYERTRFVAFTITCVSPSCWTTSGVFQVLDSSRSTRHRGAPVAASRTTKWDLPSLSRLSTTESPAMTGELASPKLSRVVTGSRSCVHL